MKKITQIKIKNNITLKSLYFTYLTHIRIAPKRKHSLKISFFCC